MKLVGNNITIDGEKTLLISGAMHYFRTLPEQWEDRLEKIAAAEMCIRDSAKGAIIGIDVAA